MKKIRKSVNLSTSYLDDLGGSNHGVVPRDLLPPCGLVIKGAIVGIGVPVPPAEEVSAAAPEGGEPDLFAAN